MGEEKKQGTVQQLEDGQLEKVTGGAGFEKWGDGESFYRNHCNDCGNNWSSLKKPSECCKCKRTNIKSDYRSR